MAMVYAEPIPRPVQRVGTTWNSWQEKVFHSIVRSFSSLHYLKADDFRFKGKLMNAWTETPTKWYPLPIAVGAMVLVYVQYRRKRRSKEVQVDENGMEVIKLKGPWQVRYTLSSLSLLSVR